MSFRHRKALFIFRRDLRLEDNTGLIAAMTGAAQTVPCFILDPRQTEAHPYRSGPAFEVMLDGLADLSRHIESAGGRLFLFQGLPHMVLEGLLAREGIDAVYANADYTPFSRARDEALQSVCRSHNIPFYVSHDATLHPPQAVAKEDGGVYTVFTPFCRKAMAMDVRHPQANACRNFYAGRMTEKTVPLPRTTITCGGGRTEALRILSRAAGLKHYARDRDIPALDGTSRLSPHNKFGTCSIREVYWTLRDALGPDHTLIKELFWRDFFTYIGFHFPHVLEGPFQARYQKIAWTDNDRAFQLWCSGQTGFPIVDAGMRELNATGFMHNRVRMITASFLVKDLHIDWRRGEKYFATKLKDYDPLVNNGNWQWAASTGCDAQPYFRVFNPWLQQAKFDPDARYIKAWVPQLRGMDAKDIHQIFKNGVELPDYPKPMVWHDAERAAALAAYRRCV